MSVRDRGCGCGDPVCIGGDAVAISAEAFADIKALCYGLAFIAEPTEPGNQSDFCTDCEDEGIPLSNDGICQTCHGTDPCTSDDALLCLFDLGLIEGWRLTSNGTTVDGYREALRKRLQAVGA